MNSSKTLFAAAALCGLSFAAHADWRPAGFFVEGGLAERSTRSLTVGGVWQWDWKRETSFGELTAVTEASLSQWSARQVGGGREGFTQVALQPLVRLRFAGGASPWFAEGGIGLSFTDTIYRNDVKTFSTRFNFKDTIGIGRNLGADRKQELSLRITHYSNASIKRPNPGENFLQLRYAMMF